MVEPWNLDRLDAPDRAFVEARLDRTDLDARERVRLNQILGSATRARVADIGRLVGMRRRERERERAAVLPHSH